MIKPEQLTAYDTTSKEVERALLILEAINVAKLDVEDRARLSSVIRDGRSLKASLYTQAHNRYIHDRGM